MIDGTVRYLAMPDPVVGKADQEIFVLGRRLLALLVRGVHATDRPVFGMDWLKSAGLVGEWEAIVNPLRALPGGVLVEAAAVEAAAGEFAERWHNDKAACLDFFMRAEERGIR